MKHRDHQKIVDQLNREDRYPSYFRSNDFKGLLLLLIIICLGSILLVAMVPTVWAWLDTRGPFFVLGLILACLFFFSMWMFFSRRR